MIPYLKEIAAMQEKIEALEKLNARRETVMVSMYNRNCDLWHSLSRLPGGLEEARRIGQQYL